MGAERDIVNIMVWGDANEKKKEVNVFEEMQKRAEKKGLTQQNTRKTKSSKYTFTTHNTFNHTSRRGKPPIRN